MATLADRIQRRVFTEPPMARKSLSFLTDQAESLNQAREAVIELWIVGGGTPWPPLVPIPRTSENINRNEGAATECRPYNFSPLTSLLAV
jgi:hypothetical protein